MQFIFLQSFLLRHAGSIWFYIADGKRATEYWFDDTQILSNSLSLKLAKLQATRIGTRNATYILQNTVREGWNYIQTPREVRAEKCVSSPQATLHSNTVCLYPGERKPALYLRTLSMAPSVSVLTGFDFKSLRGSRSKGKWISGAQEARGSSLAFLTPATQVWLYKKSEGGLVNFMVTISLFNQSNT